MKKYLSSLIFLPFFAFSQAPAGYYDGTSGLSGFALKSKLHQIISKNYNWHYGDLQEFYKQTDLDIYYDHTAANNPSAGIYLLLDIYSEIPTGTDSYEYNSTQLVGNASAEGQGWNREHMIPQSTFSSGSISNYPMYSDLFYVIPADARINQLRSNYPYGKTGSTIYYNFTNTSKIGNCAVPGLAYTGRVYEPIDEFKGDVARALLYFAVRYEGKLGSFNHNAGTTPSNDESQFDGTEERAFEPAYITMLKQWNALDPVSQREIDRNNAVFSIQKNRNPFIDNPSWVDLIWSETTDTVNPAAPLNLTVTQQNANFVNLSWTPSADTDILGYKIYVNGATTPIATSKTNSIIIDRLTPSTTYTFTIKSYDKGYLESPFSNTVNATTLASDGFAKDLMITKYLEGTGNNKAIEITNKTGHDVNLDNYNINIQYYSSTSGSYYFSDSFQLEGVVANGEVFVILNPNANFSCYTNSQAKFVTASTPLTYTGGQYIELGYKGLNTVDAVGIKNGTNSLGNQSLYRLANISQPNTTFDIAEWQSYSSNYCQNLGSLSSEELLVAEEAKIYPNPVSDVLFMTGKEISKIQNIEIYDANGRQLMRNKLPFKNSNTVNVQQLKPGIYFLKTDTQIFKFIKK